MEVEYDNSNRCHHDVQRYRPQQQDEMMIGLTTGRKRKLETDDHDDRIWELESLRRHLCNTPPFQFQSSGIQPFQNETLIQQRQADLQKQINTLVQRQAMCQTSHDSKRMRTKSRVFVKTLTGKLLTLDFEGSFNEVSVDEILDKIEEVCMIPRSDIRLVCNKKMVHENLGLSIPSGTRLQIVSQYGICGHSLDL